jgi:hypothetical protein
MAGGLGIAGWKVECVDIYSICVAYLCVRACVRACAIEGSPAYRRL